MYAASTLDREVAPHVRRVPEAELLNGATGWIEAISSYSCHTSSEIQRRHRQRDDS